MTESAHRNSKASTKCHSFSNHLNPIISYGIVSWKTNFNL